jgi:glycerol-3-phosphate acyltransferase PlsY
MKAAIWVYLLDVGKGAMVVLVARELNQLWLRPDLFLVMVGLAAILGHVFPIYLKFKGGKGVATSAGVLAVLMPLETLLAVVVFFMVLLMSRYVSMASMAAALTLPAAITVERSLLDQDVSRVYWLLAVVIGLFVPITHLRNIRRLLEGTENRFSLIRRKGGTGE